MPKEPRTAQLKRNRRNRNRGMGARQDAMSTDATTEVPWVTFSRWDPFPPRQLLRLKYTGSHTLTAGASGTFGSEQVYRANSLFDPDFTGTGHQPYFYDTLATIYNRYRVKALTIDCTFSDPSADGVAFAMSVVPNSTTGAVTNLAGFTIDVVRERPNTAVGYVNNTGGQKAHARKRFDIAAIEGLTQVEFLGSTSDYSALMTTNPTKTPFFKAAICALDGSSTPTIRLQVSIEFEVEVWERMIVAQS